MRTPSLDPAGRQRRLKRLRKDGTRRIEQLGLPDACDIETLCARLGEDRRRPLTLVPAAIESSQPCGMWLSTRDVDVIFFDADTTRAHQEHIILHELGHIICGHRTAGGMNDASARQLFPDLDPALVRDMLMRTGYDDEQEQEAEVLASLLAERIGRPAATAAPVSPDAAMERVERTLL
jgi:hypothetical protein